MPMSKDSNILTIPRLEETGFLVHGFGTRRFSEEELAAFSAEAGLRPVRMRQVHSNRIRVVDADPGAPLTGDALVTDRPGLLLLVRTADCLPILLADEHRRLVAAVHCCWRGTALGAAPSVIHLLRKQFSSRTQDILAAMGPCIQGECYEVGRDVRQAFADGGWGEEAFRDRPDHPGKFTLDLARANRLQLIDSGVPEERIFSIGDCTHCRERFFSFRREAGEAGRLFNFIGMRF
jgi:purine-nucleoside/S-methyl-5'-thioadenosine phosphorylase / adenosine deaminase